MSFPRRWQVIDNRDRVVFYRVHGRANAVATAEDCDRDQPESAPHTIKRMTESTGSGPPATVE
jgi:hypothetical protein